MEDTEFTDLKFNKLERLKKMKFGKPEKGFYIFLGILTSVLIIFSFFIVRPALAVFRVAKGLEKDTRQIKDALVLRDLVLLDEAFQKTESDLKKLEETRDKKLGWVKNIPGIKGYYNDSKYFIAAGYHGINAGYEFIKLVGPFAEAAGLTVADDVDLPQGHSGLADAFAGWVGIMPKVAEDMDVMISEVSAIGDEMQKINASRYPKKFFGQPVRLIIKSAQDNLSRVDEYAPDIKSALTLIPSMLGVESPEKRYAIIMQNDKEIRATGGFWTNYATFKVDEGALTSDFTSKDMYSIDILLDSIDAYHTFPKVPAMYEKYLKVERMYARDANVSPDFPTAIDQWMYFYKLGMQVAPWEVKPIEGVIAMDTQVVKELLEVTGPVTVNGITFNEDNVVLELEKIASLSLSEQANRKSVLGDLMEGMLLNVFESDHNLWSKLVEKGIDLVKRKHILVHMFNEDAQALIEKYNIGGSIVTPESGDYAYAVQTNLGGDKTDWFVSKDITHKLEKEDGRWLRTVSIKYDYTPKGGNYSILEKRFQDWMRLYVPKGSEIVSLDGSQDEVGVGEEGDKTYFHGFISLQPGETKTMTFKYFLPEGVVEDNKYSLYIQKQPGTNGEKHTVIVNGEEKQVYTLDANKTFTTNL